GDQQLSVEGARLVQARAAATPAERAPAGGRDWGSGTLPAALSRRRRGALALAVATLAALVVFGVGQLVLPGVAEHRLRSQLARYGVVRQVQIESAPAVELLWHRADSVKVAMDSSRSQPSGHGSLADFLSRTRSTGKLDVSVTTL